MPAYRKALILAVGVGVVVATAREPGPPTVALLGFWLGLSLYLATRPDRHR